MLSEVDVSQSAFLVVRDGGKDPRQGLGSARRSLPGEDTTGNKAPLLSTKSWSVLLRQAIADGTWDKFEVPLPHTREFSYIAVRRPKGTQHWIHFDHATQTNRDFPSDPATAGDHRQVIANTALDQDVHVRISTISGKSRTRTWI
ncbi:hypothetical protein LY78DRAFT_367344 [Colletotrichum sublineola]|nr:hypothetical protein LY78DRAFT_367344 [Colletotrichum sublineola]